MIRSFGRSVLAVGVGMMPLIVVFALVTLSGCGAKNIAPAIEDAAITARVKTALLNDQQLGATKIDVATVDRVVTLSGPVKSKADEELAVQITRGVAGVQDVRSALRIAD